jgi:hypothetical protein
MKYILIILLLISLNCKAQIPADKQLHLAAGAFCGSWGSWVGSVYTSSPEKAFLIGMSITALAGVGKETLDMGTGGSPEFKDFTATMAGGFIGAGIVYLGRKIFKKKKTPYGTFKVQRHA